MRLSATEFRTRLYSVLDQVAQTGEPVEIVRKGVTFRISVGEEAARTFSVEKLVPHPGSIAGDPGDLVDLDWSSEWAPYGVER
jgi:hypothetical protein